MRYRQPIDLTSVSEPSAGVSKLSPRIVAKERQQRTDRGVVRTLATPRLLEAFLNQRQAATIRDLTSGTSSMNAKRPCAVFGPTARRASVRPDGAHPRGWTRGRSASVLEAGMTGIERSAAPNSATLEVRSTIRMAASGLRRRFVPLTHGSTRGSIRRQPGFRRILYVDAARTAATWTRWPQLKEEYMVYSHIWDVLLKIALMVGLVVLSQSLHTEEWLRGIGVPVGYSLLTLVAIITVAWIAISRQVLSTIGSWLYARLSLGADVSLNEARQLARLFQLDLSFRWLPLKEIKQLPRTERRNALLAKLEALGPGRRSM